MSTRRPRIKAVAALPPRRKNAECSEAAKNNLDALKDGFEKGPKLPKTYRKSDDKPSTNILSPPLVSVSNPTACAQNVPAPSETESPGLSNTGNTSPKPDKAMPVSVITPTPSFKNKHDLLLTHRVRSSPERALMSPPASTSVLKSVEVAEKRSTTPIHRSESEGSSEKGVIASAKFNKTESKTPATDIPDGKTYFRFFGPAAKSQPANSSLSIAKSVEVAKKRPTPLLQSSEGSSEKDVAQKRPASPLDTSEASSDKALAQKRPATPLNNSEGSSEKAVSQERPASPLDVSEVSSDKAVGQKWSATPLHSSVGSSEKDMTASAKLNKPMCKTPATDIPDDYSIPSVPESITEDTVMDGIIPLQPEKSAPKPIALLKKEIISENAEVLFDPIVPLPSPSKVRPKLRPVPRLAPHRRNSIQGSASESEDESRRALLSGPPPRLRHDSHAGPPRPPRVRTDSACSTHAVATQQVLPPPPAPALSPVKDKHFSKYDPNSSSRARRQEMQKRMWRRRRDTAKPDSLTMYDLIFYNPTTNPFVPDQEEMKAKEQNALEAERAAADEPEPEPEPPAAVPQIKLGPNGEIMLDEKSLVIKQSDAHRKVSSVVREGSWAGAGGGRYTRAQRTADWPAAETVRFYRALAAIGTDFTLMAPLFPDRTRRDLKLKFKKEERLNGAQVDKALRSATAWDASRLLDEFAEERRLAAEQAEQERLQLLAGKKAERQRLQASKEMKLRPSKGSRALECKVDRNANSTELTADDFVRRAMRNRAREAREKRMAERTATEPPTNQPVPSFATLTLLRRPTSQPISETTNQKTPDMATLSRTNPTLPAPGSHVLNGVPNVAHGVPTNLETGSLVVLRVNNPAIPTQTMLQTYISHADGKLTPIALPPTLLNSVVGYMKKGTPSTVSNSVSSASCSPFTSPNGSNSQSGVASGPLNLSPKKRARIGSWNITTL